MTITGSAFPQTGDVVLKTFDRKDGERLAILWREYEGWHFVDIRVQFEKDGVWLPTKKGATVKLRELFELGDVIAKACELAKAVRK